jgi:hypothetical protein
MGGACSGSGHHLVLEIGNEGWDDLRSFEWLLLSVPTTVTPVTGMGFTSV